MSHVLDPELDEFAPSPRGRPLLTTCSHPGCATLTMGGGTCVEHDAPVQIVFPRGRPYVAVRQEDLALASVE